MLWNSVSPSLFLSPLYLELRCPISPYVQTSRLKTGTFEGLSHQGPWKSPWGAGHQHVVRELELAQEE